MYKNTVIQRNLIHFGITTASQKSIVLCLKQWSIYRSCPTKFTEWTIHLWKQLCLEEELLAGCFPAFSSPWHCVLLFLWHGKSIAWCVSSLLSSLFVKATFVILTFPQFWFRRETKTSWNYSWKLGYPENITKMTL